MVRRYINNTFFFLFIWIIFYNYYVIKLINNFAKQNDKYIAFSFDDGPNDTNTINILKTLKKYQAKATFFLIGSRIEKYTVKKNIYEKYNCEIGNHSFMHENVQTNDINSVRNSIIQCQNAISKTFDVVPTLFRAPYGEISDDVLSLLKELNMTPIRWSVDSEDWCTDNKDYIIANVLNNIADGDIVLMHDRNQITIDALDFILDKLNQNGYSFVTISELFKIKGLELNSDKIYNSANRKNDLIK